MNRMDRLLATLLLLQGRRSITAGEISGHFEVSIRTVYRDIAALSEGGVPVIAEAGVGYSIMRGYHVPPVMFTAGEAGALFLGGRLVDHMTDRSLEEQMQSALRKIRAVLPTSHQDHLDRLESATEVMMRPPRGDGVGCRAAFLTSIQSALADRRVLDLVYRKAGGVESSRRRVEPLGLLFYADHWHLIAHCRLRGEVRDFRSDRIETLTVCKEGFTGHEGFSLREHLKSWRDRCVLVEVVVRVAVGLVPRFRAAWLGGIVEERPEEAGVRLTLLADEGAWMAGWLLGFGSAVTILSPESLRNRVRDLAAAAAAHHASAS